MVELQLGQKISRSFSRLFPSTPVAITSSHRTQMKTLLPLFPLPSKCQLSTIPCHSTPLPCRCKNPWMDYLAQQQVVSIMPLLLLINTQSASGIHTVRPVPCMRYWKMQAQPCQRPNWSFRWVTAGTIYWHKAQCTYTMKTQAVHGTIAAMVMHHAVGAVAPHLINRWSVKLPLVPCSEYRCSVGADIWSLGFSLLTPALDHSCFILFHRYLQHDTQVLALPCELDHEQLTTQ